MIKEFAFTIYAVNDMKKAKAFYEGILGLVPGTEFNSDQWTEYTIGDSTFSLGCAPDMYKPSPEGACIAFEMEDFEAAVAKLKEHDVTFQLEPQTYPTCQMAVVLDPDGSRVIIHKRKAK
ncbi:MAG: hypothetical protein RJB39_381 [Candidatus Parcubacteria bacterium]|jgi:predicted enzyme related to lactoylglutathione lyase